MSMEFFFQNSSSEDDSDIEDLFHNDGAEILILRVAVKELGYGKRGNGEALVWCLCIPRNRVVGHDMLMRDYFT
jgi:hypothetical protein